MTAPPATRALEPARLWAIVRKESLQAVRDPSTILVAFVLPVILLFLFAFAVSLDLRDVRIGVVLETDSAPAHQLAAAFSATRYFQVTPARDRRTLAAQVVRGDLKGYVLIPQDFDERLASPGHRPLIQVITDGAQPNTAQFVSAYTQGVLSSWLAEHRAGDGELISVAPRFWFNAEIESRRALIPGAVAIVMTMIGTMLTALVVAREWERGTMEAVMATPAGIPEILLGKLLPYFGFGLLATAGCAMLATGVFGVPLRGSWPALLCLSCAFLVPALGQGLLISALARNQFVASQIALFSGFLPAFLLSGFLFEIDSMPAIIRGLTHVVAARYFVASLQTVFLAGDVWSEFVSDSLSMLGIGGVFFAIAARKTRKSLDR